ncbi:hypothetical protein RRG08_047931 [Elysia crispata]|uniref:Uncharacterized protein n=1 Tax=Elysia crispata TaxID=231223 RepID=A0AAE0ZLQ9_9GAST|nr:hypothetical protein RRG08_047931 [Elysia crispata]
MLAASWFNHSTLETYVLDTDMELATQGYTRGVGRGAIELLDKSILSVVGRTLSLSSTSTSYTIDVPSVKKVVICCVVSNVTFCDLSLRLAQVLPSLRHHMHYRTARCR